MATQIAPGRKDWLWRGDGAQSYTLSGFFEPVAFALGITGASQLANALRHFKILVLS